MRRFWTSAEDAQLRHLYTDMSAAECAAKLERTVSSVQQRVATLGLSKSPEWVAQRTRQRWAEGRQEKCRMAQFKAGQQAWNKGVRCVVGVQEGCRRTQFRKGHLGGRAAENMKPIGALRISDGQLQRKVNNDLPFMRRWVAEARLVWEAANGPVPAGHVVTFRDGRPRLKAEEITLGVLECITRVENMRRNSRHTRYPPEVNQLIQLKGALNRKINRHMKESK